MQDKYVRRRRAVLAVLVVVSLILLTAYFGEADNSPLHSVQQGIVEVFTPIQEGASKVLSPVRDLAGWVSSTVHAKSQNAQLLKRNATLDNQLAQEGTALQEYRQLAATVKLKDRLSLNQYGPVAASVFTYNPQVWYETVSIDKGTGAGIEPGDPVISAGGLVGKIQSAGANYAVVAELSSQKFGVEAAIMYGNGGRTVGTLQPEVGKPTILQVNYLSPKANIFNGDEVVTAGYSLASNSAIKSLYPPGIPIGRVTNFDPNTLIDDGQVDVSPFVNLRNVSQVEVLTKVHG